MINTLMTPPIAPFVVRRPTSAPSPSAAFEWIMVLLGSWVMGGAYLDAWAHRHVGRLETFFTPWHAVLYSGVAVTGTYLFLNLLRGRAAGRSWRSALPTGYGLSFVGFVLFGIAGNLDLLWHTIFGIERAYSAILSPTHLLLMTSAALMVTGALRAAWHSGHPRLTYTGVVAATLFLSVLVFFSQDIHPFVRQWSAIGPTPAYLLNDQGEQLGVVEVIVQTAILAGVVLYLLGRFSLPRGSLTIMLTITSLALVATWQLDPVILVGVLGGVIGDLLLSLLRPTPARPLAFHAFAALFPVAVFGLYFLGIRQADGIWWPVYAWTGAIVVAGATGLLLSFLALPSIRRELA